MSEPKQYHTKSYVMLYPIYGEKEGTQTTVEGYIYAGSHEDARKTVTALLQQRDLVKEVLNVNVEEV